MRAEDPEKSTPSPLLTVDDWVQVYFRNQYLLLLQMLSSITMLAVFSLTWLQLFWDFDETKRVLLAGSSARGSPLSIKEH